MEKIIVAAVSVQNLIGQADKSIDNLKKWVALAREKGAELVLFPELNVNGMGFPGVFIISAAAGPSEHL
jgi:predicted amidohydrolase